MASDVTLPMVTALLRCTGIAGRTPLHEAALGTTTGHIKVVQMLHEKGADIEATDSEGKTALVLAVDGNVSHDVALALLELGANENASTVEIGKKGGKTVLEMLKYRSSKGDTAEDRKRKALEEAVLALLSNRKHKCVPCCALHCVSCSRMVARVSD